MKSKYLVITSLFLFLFMGMTGTAWAYDLTVAKDGSGNYTTVQAAVNAAPTGLTAPYTIYIKNGRYKERVNIPSNKPFIQLIGESVAHVVITYDDYTGKPIPIGGTYGTSNNATVIVNGADFAAFNITFENTTGDAPQALAINVNADRAAFSNCRFHGGQDTLLTNKDNAPQYFRNCYIDGVVDFIFGGSKVIFDSCIIYPRTRLDGGNGGYITAANTAAASPYGYVFRNCKIMSNYGTTTYFLGRPWNNSTGSVPPANNKVVFLNSTMSHTIKPQGWTVWDAGTITSVITYAEYKSKKFDGNLVDTTQRVSWSHQLTSTEAAAYTTSALFGTWDPCTVVGCSPFTPDIAISNFQGIKNASLTTLRWNISWPITGVKYELFRSKDSITYSKLYETTSVNDTNINFQTTDTLPLAGGTWFYYILASKPGFATLNTDTIKVTMASNIQITASVGNFLQGLGTPSPSQSYTVSGVSITNGITITPPADYEISGDSLNWQNTSTPITLPAVSGVVAAKKIWVRLNAASTGTHNGVITHTTANHAVMGLRVSGTTQSNAIQPDSVLAYWPYTINSNDSTPFRAPYVSVAKDTLFRLYVSAGAIIPAYSALYGQALNGNNNGGGSWPAGYTIPNSVNYKQYTIAPTSTSGLRVTTVTLSSSFYKSSAGKLALVYSVSNFISDSASATSVIYQGSPLPLTAYGSFAAPILLRDDTTGTTDNYQFRLSGNAGITVLPGQTLTVRLYYGTVVTGAGVYAKVKDVYLRGNAVEVPNLGLFHQNGVKKTISLYPNPVTTSFIIRHTAAAKGSVVKVYGTDGKLAFQQTLTGNATETTVNASGLAPGHYIAVVVNGGDSSSVRFVKQ